MFEEMTLIPLGDRILVKPNLEKKEISGLIVPDVVSKRPSEGIVVAVGQGKIDENGIIIPMQIKQGDKVFYGKYAGNEIKIVDTEYVILHQDDIFGVIPK